MPRNPGGKDIEEKCIMRFLQYHSCLSFQVPWEMLVGHEKKKTKGKAVGNGPIDRRFNY